ncbi:MAG: hypothetical protein IPM26_08895 [Saprospiraceae bacterium]|nr:hypothetical protein [Saprospiraceae bacterium]
MKSLQYFLLAITLLTASITTYQIWQMNKSIPDRREYFNIMKFELPCSKEALDSLIKFWTSDIERKEFVIQQLHIDYVFMSVIFPFVMVWCLRMRSRYISVNQGESKNILAKILLIFGLLQLLAWAFDFFENRQLEEWIIAGKAGEIALFKALVISKFIIILVGVFLSIITYIKTRNFSAKNTSEEY